MKGLYLNVPDALAAIDRMDALLGLRTSVARARHTAFPDIVIGYHPEAWPDGPVIDEPGLFAAASGWFVFRGRRGDLRGFARAFAEARGRGEQKRVLSDITAGAYLLLLSVNKEAIAITDPLGLHPHYFADEPFAQIAPSPHFIKEGRSPVPAHEAILRAVNHLFGNLTLYRGIERLEPGAIITARSIDRWFPYESECGDVRQVPGAIADGLATFRDATTIVPISGGLDSRLIALSGFFDRGYTFGPPTTGDRPVARKFAERFRDYKEFSLMEIAYPIAVRETSAEILDGVCLRPFVELIPVYQHLHRAWGGGYFFDGYLGDALQRGTYLTHGGVRGSLAKLLPSMTLRGFNALEFLRRRYSALSANDFTLVADLYRRKMEGMGLDDLHKVFLFEAIHGRGARHVINGGTIMSGQFWTPVQPFCFSSVFRLFFGQDLEDTLSFRTVRRVWSVVPRSGAEVRTYSGFNPQWNEHRSRATTLLFKGMGKARLHRRVVSYESELPLVRWQ